MSNGDAARRTAIRLVSEGHEPTFYELVSWIRQETGVSSAEANRTVMRLLGNGTFRTTMGSRIVTGRGGGGGGGGVKSTLEIMAAVLGIIAAVLGIWQGLVQFKVIQGPGPIQIVFPSGFPFPSSNGFPTGGDIPSLPDFPTDPAPEVPTGLSVSGTCDTHLELRWNAVAGADKYRIVRNGSEVGVTDETRWPIPGPVDNESAEWAVRAVSGFPESKSPPSSSIAIEGCGFG